MVCISGQSEYQRLLVRNRTVSYGWLKKIALLSEACECYPIIRPPFRRDVTIADMSRIVRQSVRNMTEYRSGLRYSHLTAERILKT
jgi:hypothetical protein